MKTRINRIIGLIFIISAICCFTNIIFAQSLIQLESISLPSSTIDINTNDAHTLEARKEVVFKNGFIFTGNPSRTLHAKINEKIYANQDYSAQTNDPSSPQYPDNRILDKNLAIGSIPGEINVGPSGAATYTMPIDLPEGVSGLKPQLSIVYNSGGGNSILGHNFGLSGISRITLTPSTFYIDGKFQNATQDGPFSLDGQRLIRVSGENYKTEQENYLNITNSGAFKVDSWFIAEDTRSRLIYEYGKAENSKIAHLPMGTYAWNLNKVTDRFGNNITYVYRPRQLNEFDYNNEKIPNTRDEVIIDKIIYGKDGEKTEIEFIYNLRDDDYHTKFCGLLQTGNSTLLDKIYVKSQGKLISVYHFRYFKNSMGQSCLAEVTRKNGTNEQLNSTLFRWNEPNPIHLTPKTLSFSIPFNKSTDFKGDFNDDGITDLLVKNGSSYYDYYKFDKNGNPTKKTHYLASGITLLCSGNFDGKTGDEIMGYSDDHCCLYMIDEEGIKRILQDGLAVSQPHKVTADLNSNGIADIYIGNYMYEFAPGSSSLIGGYYLGALNVPFTSIYVGDFDNNGFVDYIVNGIYKGLASGYVSPNNTFNIVKADKYYDELGNDLGYLTYYGAFDRNNDGLTETFKHYQSIHTERESVADYNNDGDTDDSFTCYQVEDRLVWPWEYDYYSYESYPTVEMMEFTDRTVYGGMITDFYMDGDEVWPMAEDKSQVTDINGDGIPEYIFRDKANMNTYLLTTQSKSLAQPNYTVFADDVGTLTGDFNGDGATDFLNGNKLYYCPEPKRTSVAAIIDGNNNKIAINYGTKIDIGIEQPEYPLMRLKGPFHVVDNIKKTIGNESFTSSYSYKNSRYHATGKGFLGFLEVTETNDDLGKKNISTYGIREPYGFTYLNSQVNSNLFNGNYYTLSTAENIFELESLGNARYAIKSQQEIQTDFNNNKTIKSFVYNSANGNLESESVEKKSGTQTITSQSTTYANFIYPGMPQTINVISSRIGKAITGTQTTTCTYWDETWLLKSSTTYGLKKDYFYNSYGNLIRIETSGADITTKIDEYFYEDRQLFVKDKFVKDNDKINHKTSKFYNLLGNVIEEYNENNLAAYHTYDNWGNLVSTKTPEGFNYTYQRAWADASAPAGSFYYTAEFKDGVLQTKDYFNQLGQKIHSISLAQSGVQLNSSFQYNKRGDLIEKTEPQPSNPSVNLKTTYTYNEEYGRMKKETTPYFVKDYSYSGNVYTTTIEKDGITDRFEKTYDASGVLVQAEDNGGIIKYFYDFDNQLEQIESPGGAITKITYNSERRQKTLEDPDAGTITFNEYFASGNVKKKTDAKGKITTYTYDVLDRIKTEIIEGVTYTYSYDADSKSIGLLSKIVSNSSNLDEENYTYDSDGFGRVKTKTRKTKDKSLTFKYEYDDKGRVIKLTYPYDFAISYEYNSYDDLIKVKNALDNTLIWQLDNVNAYGQIEKVTYGNGKQTTYGYDPYQRLSSIKVPGIIDFNYVFNDRQQLKSREEKYYNNGNWNGFKESFTYDDLNRLETASIGSVETMRMQYQTSVKNRIDQKSDIGQYNYSVSTNHRLSSIDATSTFYLPHEHNQITYTARLKLATLTDYVTTSQKRTLNIEYGIDNERFKQVVTDEFNNEFKTWYTDNLEEQEIPGPGTDKINRKLNYVFAGGELVAIMVQSNDPNNGMHYVYTDYLGSLRCITSANGTIEHKLGFDAWGNRRNPETGDAITVLPSNLFTSRGFTYHEHLDLFGLINMNGRVYDPAIGMFLSPDPYVQAPDFTQNFNRYAYVLNNPLMYTDPSGEFIFTLLAAIFCPPLLPVAIGTDIGWISGGIRAKSQGETFWHGAWRGGVVGAVGGGLSMIGGAGMSFAQNLLLGTAEGAITGGLDAALWGNDVGKGVLWGMAGGAVFTTLTSENFSNWTKGEGFYTNENVFNHMMANVTNKQDIIDYFGFKGTYKQKMSSSYYISDDYWGCTDPKNGIFFGDLAFSDYGTLKGVYIKESYHAQKLAKGIPWTKVPKEYQGLKMDLFPEEIEGYVYAYKNQGLFIKNKIPWGGLNSYISQLQVYGITPPYSSYPKSWIYKIPRRW